MKYIITENQVEKLHSIIQNLIDSELIGLKEESEEWGLGEMDDIDEINSIDRIEIDRVVPHLGTKVYINIHSNSDRDDFQNIRAELQYRVDQWFPNIKLFINDIIHINNER
jgi:hypothetical protein